MVRNACLDAEICAALSEHHFLNFERLISGGQARKSELNLGFVVV